MAPSGAVAIALPGFGIAMRSAAGEPFAYVCDALLGVTPSEGAPALSFAANGSLLVGSVSGLRSVDTRGCPRADFGGELQQQPLARLSVHPAQPNLVYAVTEATLPRVWRSRDGGETWKQGAALTALDPVTALVLDPSEADTVYVSQATPGNGSLLHVSTDGGASFSTVTQKPGLALLDVEPAGDAGDAGVARWWAVGRSASAMTNQGFSLFGAASPTGPWQAVSDVRFFGGFARDPGGALWIGDEAGGVFRSTDGGGSFTNVSSATAVSCLHFGQGALWGCTPGIAEQTTLVTWSDERQAFDGVTRLADVTRMVDCGPELDVATKCAAAWVEWQRDILMLPQTPTNPDGGTGGAPPILPEPDADVPEASPVPPDPSTSVGASESSGSGCAIAARNGAAITGRCFPGTSQGAFVVGVFWLAASARRFRRSARCAAS